MTDDHGLQQPSSPVARSLLDKFMPRRETLALLHELRSDPTLRALLDGHSGEPDQREDAIGPQLASSQARAEPQLTPSGDATDLSIVVDYANGMTQAEIAHKHGLHIQTIRGRLKRAGVIARGHNAALTADDLQEARSMMRAGRSARATARQLGVAHTTLLRALRRADTSGT